MDVAGRLARIQQEIVQVENEKLRREQTLGLFWEHLPAVDPILIRDRMLFIKSQIQSLENRKTVLLHQQEELLVTVAIIREPPTVTGEETGRN
jgi:hypothetical protein